MENKIPNITKLATKAALNRKVTEIENKIPHSGSLIATLEYNRLPKVNFHATSKKAEKSFTSKTEVKKNALGLSHKNREKNNLQTCNLMNFCG